MEFKVPQFIDIEDTLFGQFTFVQIVYVIGGASMSYIIWTILPSFLALLSVGVVMLLSLSLAFYPKDKYGKPFIGIMEAGFHFYFISSKLYTWKRVPKKRVPKEDPSKRKTMSVTVPNISDSNLKTLSWGLDINKEVS